MTATEEMINRVTELSYEDLPEEVVTTAKKATLDTLACIFAGSRYTSIPQMVELIRGWGGTKESTILIYGDKVPAPHAAFANGVMAKAVDMDDAHPMSSHVSEYIIPSMLAMAELQGGASGKEFITAYVAGAEPAHRIGAAVGGLAESSKRARYLGIAGKLGATISVAKLHHLNREQTANALGLAYVMSACWSGAKSSPVGTGASYFEPGYQCQAALEHTLLAGLGVSGPREILAGPMGVYSQYLNWKEVDPQSVMADWGKRWLTPDTQIKLYSACGHTHAAIQGMLELATENKIVARDIASISLNVHSGAMKLTGNPERWSPKDERDAKFSLPFTVATAAIKGKVFPDDFSPQELEREDIHQMMNRITIKSDEKIPSGVAIVTVELKDGRVLTKEGRMAEKVAWDELISKLHKCASLSARPMPEASLARLAEQVSRLEELGNVTAIISLFS